MDRPHFSTNSFCSGVFTELLICSLATKVFFLTHRRRRRCRRAIPCTVQICVAPIPTRRKPPLLTDGSVAAAGSRGFLRRTRLAGAYRQVAGLFVLFSVLVEAVCYVAGMLPPVHCIPTPAPWGERGDTRPPGSRAGTRPALPPSLRMRSSRSLLPPLTADRCRDRLGF